MKTMLLLLAMLTLQAQAIEPLHFDDPDKEAMYQQLTQELRCLVCQNQNLADSDAELAGDLRREVYELVQSGKSAEEVKAFLVQRYGDFVLYRPPLQKNTLLLWAAPVLLLLLGLFAFWRFLAHQAANSSRRPQADANQADPLDLLQDEEP